MGDDDSVYRVHTVVTREPTFVMPCRLHLPLEGSGDGKHPFRELQLIIAFRWVCTRFGFLMYL